MVRPEPTATFSGTLACEIAARVASKVASKVAWRLVPLLMLCYFVAFLDRANVSFAALTMNADLGFDSAVFGLGAGIFFLGYFIFEVPSNLALALLGGNLGGFAGPYFMGWVKAATGAYSLALVVIGVGLAISGVIALALRGAVGHERPPPI